MKKCDIEGCNENGYHKHHIVSRCYGGTNDKHNLCKLCPNHHYEVHNGNLIIEGWFMTTEGMKLLSHLNNETTITGGENVDKVYII